MKSFYDSYKIFDLKVNALSEILFILLHYNKNSFMNEHPTKIKNETSA